MFHINGISFDELTSDPVSPIDGECWYNSTEGLLKIQLNGETKQLQTISFKVDVVTISNPATKTYALSFVPLADAETVSQNGLVLTKGVSDDYTITGNSLTFDNSVNLAVGDKIRVQYHY